jgi:hypothetical protein
VIAVVRELELKDGSGGLVSRPVGTPLRN